LFLNRIQPYIRLEISAFSRAEIFHFLGREKLLPAQEKIFLCAGKNKSGLGEEEKGGRGEYKRGKEREWVRHQ